MSVKDFNKVLTITDATTGDILDNISLSTYNEGTIICMINNLISNIVLFNEHDLIINVGYKASCK